MVDPRLETIQKRLENVKDIIAVSGGKGGVGKSLTASTLALLLSDSGCEVGLLDLDFLGPSADMILGLEDFSFPKEDKGILPKEIGNIKFLSIVPFSKDRPLALRGEEISDAIIELLSITRWNSLDFLIIDMPPGISDELLEAVRLIEDLKFLIVTTGSKLAFKTTKKEIKILKRHGVEILGVLQNMDFGGRIEGKIDELEVPFLGHIRSDDKVEEAIGDRKELLETGFSKDLKSMVLEYLI